AMCLEAAERIGDGKVVNVVENLRDGRINRPPIARRQVVIVPRVKIARAADDVPLVRLDLADEIRNPLGLMLLVAVHGDDPLIAASIGIAERVDQALPVTAIFGMPDELDVPAGL